jgi:ribosomal protein S18 acetylase RimI-like enzyme
MLDATPMLRQAAIEDADRIALLHAESWRRTYRGMMRDDFLEGDVVQDRLSAWRERLSSPAQNQLVVVAEGGGGVMLGFICVLGDDDTRWGSLVDNLHVRHDVQTQGIGRQLMREAAEWAAATYPGRGLYLWVMQANQNAQRFYERLGGINQGAEVREDAGRGEAHVFRYAWPDARAATA